MPRYFKAKFEIFQKVPKGPKRCKKGVRKAKVFFSFFVLVVVVGEGQGPRVIWDEYDVVMV